MTENTAVAALQTLARDSVDLRNSWRLVAAALRMTLTPFCPSFRQVELRLRKFISKGPALNFKETYDGMARRHSIILTWRLTSSRTRMLLRVKLKDTTSQCIVQNNQETLQPDLRAC